MYLRRIEDLRTDHDKTQKNVAEYLHLNLEVYRRYEKGIREIPVWALIRLAKLYGEGIITRETALTYASNPDMLSRKIRP